MVLTGSRTGLTRMPACTSHIRCTLHTTPIDVYLLESQFCCALELCSRRKPRGVPDVAVAAVQPITEHGIRHGDVTEPSVSRVGHGDTVLNSVSRVRDGRVKATGSRDVDDVLQDLHSGLPWKRCGTRRIIDNLQRGRCRRQRNDGCCIRNRTGVNVRLNSQQHQYGEVNDYIHQLLCSGT